MKTVSQLAIEFLVYLDSVRGFSSNSVVAYKNNLSHLEELVGSDKNIEDVAPNDLRLCIAKLSAEKKSSASINQFIAAARAFFSYCRKFGYIEKNPSLDLKSVKIPKHLPRFLTSAEVDSLCSLPEKNELLWEKRDKALFEMMYSSGCRVSEIVSLKLNDFQSENSSAIVKGKGRKERKVYFEDDARAALKEYLEDRKKRFAENNKSPFVFVNQQGKPLTTGGVRYILSRYSGNEGLKHHISPHALRHTFATAMLSNGADVRIVQEMLGHSNISTTQKYTHITTSQLIEIYKHAHPHGEK